MASGPYLDEIAELVDAGKVGPPRIPFPGNCGVDILLIDCPAVLIPGNTPAGGVGYGEGWGERRVLWFSFCCHSVHGEAAQSAQ